ncbi:MAG: hypothetical protein IPK16_28085 [Anaerolineales bacterium]|nr:hypothetical protein [Anaerolineales bacterium]
MHTPEYDSALFGTEVHNVLVGWGTPADKAANLKRLAAWTAADDERFADLSKQLEALTLNRQTLKDEVEKLAMAQTAFIALQSADSAVLELAYRISDTLLTDLKQVSQSIEEKRLRLATVEAQAIR